MKRAPGDRVLFSGNRHESVPRALFFDVRLTPLERNAWQVFRMQVQDDGVSAFPTYDELSPYLASIPCSGRASHETVARALTLLRLTRWLSLVRRGRDPQTGCFQGNVYVLHDEPLTPFEAMQLDADYLDLVGQALSHAAKSVRIVAEYTLKEIAEDPLVSSRVLPTRLQVLTQHLAEQGWTSTGYPQATTDHDSEGGPGSRLRNRGKPSSESEPGRKPAPNQPLRNPKSDSTVRIQGSSIELPTTVPRTREDRRMRLPERFRQLKAEQQAGALAALEQVDATMRQSVLDEWDARCEKNGVRSPPGYLFGMVQKALRGEFNAWAATEEPENRPAGPSPPPPFPAAAPIKLASPETIQACLARLRPVLGRK